MESSRRRWRWRQRRGRRRDLHEIYAPARYPPCSSRLLPVLLHAPSYARVSSPYAPHASSLCSSRPSLCSSCPFPILLHALHDPPYAPHAPSLCSSRPFPILLLALPYAPPCSSLCSSCPFPMLQSLPFPMLLAPAPYAALLTEACADDVCGRDGAALHAPHQLHQRKVHEVRRRHGGERESGEGRRA